MKKLNLPGWNNPNDLIGGESTKKILEKVNSLYPDPEHETLEEQKAVIAQFIHWIVQDLVDRDGNEMKVMPIKQYNRDEIKLLEDKMRQEGRL